MSELLTIGISHKTAPVVLRERVALLEGPAPGVLPAISRRSPRSLQARTTPLRQHRIIEETSRQALAKGSRMMKSIRSTVVIGAAAVGVLLATIPVTVR